MFRLSQTPILDGLHQRKAPTDWSTEELVDDAQARPEGKGDEFPRTNRESGPDLAQNLNEPNERRPRSSRTANGAPGPSQDRWNLRHTAGWYFEHEDDRPLRHREKSSLCTFCRGAFGHLTASHVVLATLLGCGPPPQFQVDQELQMCVSPVRLAASLPVGGLKAKR